MHREAECEAHIAYLPRHHEAEHKAAYGVDVGVLAIDLHLVEGTEIANADARLTGTRKACRVVVVGRKILDVSGHSAAHRDGARAHAEGVDRLRRSAGCEAYEAAHCDEGRGRECAECAHD